MFDCTKRILRPRLMLWLTSGVLPLPILLTVDTRKSAFLACVYLGLGCAWLCAEIYLAGGLPTSVRAWGERMLAISTAVGANTAIFVLFGTLGGVHTAFPFPLMAALSAIPAIGVIPWLARRVGHAAQAIILGSAILLVAKLSACVIAGITYGPDFVEQGYVAADWHTAKLMISLFWSFSTLLSLALFWAESQSTCNHVERKSGVD